MSSAAVGSVASSCGVKRFLRMIVLELEELVSVVEFVVDEGVRDCGSSSSQSASLLDEGG